MMWRQLSRNRLMTAVNFVGLAISSSILMLLALLIYHEVDYNYPIRDSDRLVLVGSDLTRTNSRMRWPIVAFLVPEDLMREVPGIESYTRISNNWTGSYAMTRGDRQIYTTGVMFVDTTFFDVLGVRLVQGDPATALASPESAVISREFARKMFGSEDPMGQEFLYRGNRSVTVTGVIDDLPSPSFIDGTQVLLPWTALNPNTGTHWASNINYTCLLKLEPGITVDDIRPTVDKITPAHLPENVGTNGLKFILTLTPLRQLYLYGNFDSFPIGSGRLNFVLQFVAIGIFLLLIATLNYINLTTAQSLRRGVYVGVAKTLGANRAQLVRQFLSEAILITFFSVLTGALIATLLLPLFSHWVNLDLAKVLPGVPMIALGLVIISVLFGTLLGAVPALLLSKMKPMFALKRNASTGRGGSLLRGSLVVLQFAVASGLIVASLVVMRQMNYINTRDIGYDREHVLTVRLPNWDLMTSFKPLYDKLRSYPYVLSSSTADNLPTNSSGTSTYHVPGTPEDQRVFLSVRRVDHSYIQTLGMHLIAGRNFDPERSLDSLNAVIVNQAAARALGFGNDPVGKNFGELRFAWTHEYGQAEIIGMVEDFMTESMRHEVQPIFLRLYEGYPPYLIFRLQPGSEAQAVANLQNEWKTFAPGIPLQYSFLDEYFDAQYRTEQRLSKLFKLFTLVAIVVAGLGLFALSAFIAERRTKEIGVRKVLGAHVPQIVTLLVGDFLKLVVAANLLAGPFAWWLMKQWLNGYAYRTRLEWWLFGATFGLSVVLALIAVSVHAIRASLTNPVNALRDE